MEITRPNPFSGAPELASVLLLAAGLFFIASVQAAVWMRRHAVSPSEMEEWYPHYFRESGVPEDGVDDQTDSSGLPLAMDPFWRSTKDWKHRQVGKRWYGAEVRQRMYVEVLAANRWANWTRGLYHAGILALLVSLTAVVWPPHGQWTGWRDVLLGVAVTGALSECLWIVGTSSGFV